MFALVSACSPSKPKPKHVAQRGADLPGGCGTSARHRAPSSSVHVRQTGAWHEGAAPLRTSMPDRMSATASWIVSPRGAFDPGSVLQAGSTREAGRTGCAECGAHACLLARASLRRDKAVPPRALPGSSQLPDPLQVGIPPWARWCARRVGLLTAHAAGRSAHDTFLLPPPAARPGCGRPACMRVL